MGIEVFTQQRGGLNQACKEAAERCKCEAFVFFHPKGTVPVEDTYKFREYFEKGYDLVVASRMMIESINEEDDKFFKPRKWFGLFLGLIVRILFKRDGGATIWDTLHGFRGMTLSAFNDLEISDMSPSIDIGMVCRAYKLKKTRIEFPTKERIRIEGATHFKAFATGRKLVKYILWEITRRR